MATVEIVIAALGRPFTLGMLYDARRDQIIPGATLWDEKDLHRMIKEKDHHGSDCQITTSDSLDEKSIRLDVGASLKASFLGGLVTVEGSAKYLNDRKQSLSHSRVTFQYNATTMFKQLMFSADDIKKAKQLSDDIQGSATHIVTGILYGAKAFFVFDSQTSEASSVQEIEGRMKAVINKIPSLNVEAELELQLTDSEKDICKEMMCKFYGDFLLGSNPTTFKDAVKAYSDLPKLLDNKKKAGVPMKVWMIPLNSFFPSAAVMMADICAGTIVKVQDALEDLCELKMRCNKCLEDRHNFPLITEKLKNFQKCCDVITTNIRHILAKKIPSIRDGEIKEEELLKLTDDKDTCQFSSEELKVLMENLEREITVIRSLEEMMKPAKIIQSAAELDREILDPEVEEIICFVFTSLKSKAEWYLSDELIEKAREKAKMLGDLARALKESSRYRCLVTAIDDPTHEGATIYHYGNSKCLSKDFEKPTIDDVEKITERKELIWYATDLTLDPDTVQQHIVLSGNRKATYEQEPKSYPDVPQRFDQACAVLCREKLNNRHYWEVEWSLHQMSDVAAAICYGSMARKGHGLETLFGKNDKSLSFGYIGATFTFILYFNNEKSSIPVPFTGCPRVGMFLDWEKGTLSCYIVTGEELKHIHTFYKKLSEPVYLGFWIYDTDSFIHLHF